MSKYYGNQKYIDQLVSYYTAKNSATKAHEEYKKLSSQDKVIVAQQTFIPPISCCVSGIVRVWETWEYFNWDVDEHVWGTEIVF